MALIDRLVAFGRRFAPRGPVLRHAARTGIAALSAEIAAAVLGLPQGYWALISAISVVQLTVGATLGMAFNRLLGTVAGAALGMFGLWLCASQGVASWLCLPAVVALGAYLGAAHPALRVAAVTAAIILLGPAGGDDLTASGVARVGDVVIGSLVGIATSALLLPSYAAAAMNRRLAATLTAGAELLAVQVARLVGLPHEPAAVVSLNLAIRTGLAAADTLAVDARRELEGYLADHSDPAALVRSARRLWYSLIMVGRAADSALPPPVLGPVWPALDALAEAIGLAIRGCALSLERRRPAPSLAGVIGAQQGLAQAIEALRSGGTLRLVDSMAVARLFTTWFALDQVVDGLQDLAGQVDEQAADGP